MRSQSGIEQLIRKRVFDHPDETWLKWKDEEFTWSEMLSASQRAANGLLELGVGPGDRVAIMLSNRPEFLWAHFGLGFIGAVAVPVNTAQRGPALHHIFTDSGVVAAIVDADVLPVVAPLRETVESLRYVVAADGAGRAADWTLDRLMSGADREPQVAWDGSTPGMLVYTSGTTGPPKGILTTATAGDSGALDEMIRRAGVQPGETIYSGLPLFHGNALHLSMTVSILVDAKFALAPKFTASGLLHDLRRYDVNLFNAIGGIVSILLKQPERPDDRENPVHTVIASGAPADRWHAFEERFGVRLVELYGMSDSPGFLLNADGKVGALGKSGLGGVEFRVVDEQEQPLEPGNVGELVFKHPQGRLTEYHNLPDATEKAYRGGWFHSGDLAEMDAEGYFYYRGRKTESMRRLGENISAWEIETTLNAHPSVLESAAHKVPSDLGGDEVKVCVVLRPGAELEPEALLDYCRQQLARHAIPRYVEFMDEIPKTPSERNRYADLKARGITPATYDAMAGARR